MSGCVLSSNLFCDPVTMARAKIVKVSLVVVRSLQIACSLAIAVMFAYLTGLISRGRLGLTTRMISIEIMVHISHPLLTLLSLFISTFNSNFTTDLLRVWHLSNLLYSYATSNPPSPDKPFSDSLVFSTHMPMPAWIT
jgi:hypothetical protein